MAGYIAQGCKWCITEPCNACAHGCVGCCRTFDAACGGVSNFLCPRDRASPVFLVYTLALNAVSGAIAVVVATLHWRNDCYKPLALWLVVTGVIFNLFMIAFAARLHHQFNKPGSVGRQQAGSSLQRFWHIFLWEPLVAAYFVAAPTAFVWSVFGLAWAAKSAEAKHHAKLHRETPHCSAALIHFTRVCAILMIVYLTLSFVVAVAGWLCACVCAPFRTADEEFAEEYSYQQAGQPATRPASGDPGSSFINSLFHPQQQFGRQQTYTPDYDALPGSADAAAAPPQQQFDPRGPPPPSGVAAPSAPEVGGNGKPAAVPKLNLPQK